MEKSTNFPLLALAFAIALAIVAMPVNSQSGSGSSSICSGAMMRSFTSCISYLSGGSNGSSSPTEACCSSLRSLMSNGQDCLCLIVTGGVPFQIPLNRTLALSLPRACRMSGVPVECKATASPVPAPDPNSPDLNAPSMSPGTFAPPPQGQSIPRSSPPSSTPRGSSPPSSTPGGGLIQPQVPSGGNVGPTLTPPGGNVGPNLTPPGGNIVPTLTPPGMRPTLTPSAAEPSHSGLSSLLVAAVFGAILLNC